MFMFKFLAILAIIMFLWDWYKAPRKGEFWCGLIGHNWFKGEYGECCLRCGERK